MGAVSAPASIKRLPQATAATAAVVGLPVLAVSLLRSLGGVDSVVLLAGAAIVLSIAVSCVGSALWTIRSKAGDTVFGDLMLWGWVWRRLQERRLASATRMLEPRGARVWRRQTDLGLRERARLLERLARTMEARDPYTQGHSRRVARHAVAIAKRMGLPREEIARIRTAAAVHDVGKIETPREIMNKPGRLTGEEFAVIKLHPVAGARMVAGLGDDELTRIVRHHHERLDGGGYPDGLGGDRIPLGARILAVADTFDAITSTRPYRSARRHKEALEVLAAEAGKQLDPDAVRAFRAYYSGLRPVAFWAFFANGPRLFALLVDELRLGGLGVAAKAAVATGATVIAGAVASHALRAGPESPAAQASEPIASRLVDAGGGSAVRRQPADGSSHTKGSRGQVGVDAPDHGELDRGVSGSPSSSTEGGGGSAPGDRAAGGSGEGSGSTGKGGNDSGAGGRGGDSNDDTPALLDTSDAVAKATEPVATVVDTVAKTVEPLPVKVPTPVPDVREVVPKPPPVDLGGN
ncbi:MAG TPA: HD-GYP domain-containing protein [Solirubrobacterales bacterium]